MNAVGPGVVHTAMTEVSAARAGRTMEEHLRFQAASIPRDRTGTPHDIARAVLFFTAEDATSPPDRSSTSAADRTAERRHSPRPGSRMPSIR
ncbi:hypothetical protein [Kribbella antibiotica]|uniref:hypothetical protein n=1 Tax=Kribbella antibiotica TaxID=190195 RepID=UPI00192DF01F|nr:hypothetical protein [Kribbella antibiotica]